jgi:glycerate 2-kinase
MKKIVIAPQGFKGSLSGPRVAEAIASGLRRVLPNAELVLLPMADGGEGTVEALVNGTHGQFRRTQATGPLGDIVEAKWGVLGDGATGVIEMAAASGITLVPAGELDPLIATTYGTGEMIKAALDAGCRELIIGVGGSATNDGGAGMAQALGVKLLDGNGNELPRGGLSLARLNHIDVSGLDQRLNGLNVVVLSDVTNLLCGEKGASRIYGPQKGATPEMVRRLDCALANFAEVIERDMGIDVTTIPGGGAAGGLGAGLAAFLKARITAGVEAVSQAVGLEGHLKEASLLFTGEGRIDSQTSFGKTVAGIAGKARKAGVPVIAIAGELTGGSQELYSSGIDSALSIASGPMSLQQSMGNAQKLIEDAAERAIRLVLIGCRWPSL